ncbi:hypothetical protein VIGAN_01415900 [Vigna angularis var. angularis]|uniref:Uncharacterized protein n=1 Tax=Vigna angularis var. angularis TaxID=157739 RepID=A0A0S3R6R8_PHAAN|nr:hypothetical protein VIGAN_01415900 [Vigna angularis var. angularis]
MRDQGEIFSNPKRYRKLVRNTQVLGYSDAECCALLGGNLIHWKSKKQSIIVRSNAKVEHKSMAQNPCELVGSSITLGQKNYS